MRFLVTLLCCLGCVPALAGVLSEADVAKLKADITAMYERFEKGDPGVVIANTHESIYPLVGGEEGFDTVMRESLQQLEQLNTKFLSSEIGASTQTYPAGDEEVCFVPRISVMELQGKKAKSTGFLIAIRRVGSSTWKYLDGGGLRKHPEMLKLLLPKLTAEVALPPNTVELL